jgi:hypothetical protein
VPFLRGGHFSVYVINFIHHRVDILDPNPWNLIGDGWKQTHKGNVEYGKHKGQWCKIMMRRLSEAIQIARPYSGIPKFGNFKCEMVDDIPKQAVGSNDYDFYVMWYMEYYDVGTDKVNWPYSVCVLMHSCRKFLYNVQHISKHLFNLTAFRFICTAVWH